MYFLFLIQSEIIFRHLVIDILYEIYQAVCVPGFDHY